MKRSTCLVCAALAALSTLSALAAGPNGVGTSTTYHGPVGLQLYSLRTTFATNVDAGFKGAKDMGFVEVELASTYNLSLEQLGEKFKANGLKPVSGLYDYNQFDKDLGSIIKQAKAFGLKYVGTAYIPHDGEFTEKACRETAAYFNRVGEALAKEGITFVYHNHGFEFVPYKDGTLMDLLIQETNPKYVSFEIDIMWAYFPAQDPAKLLKKYPGRWALMHIKDLRKGVATGSLRGWTEETNDVPIGSGQLNIPAIMRAAQEVGVKHYFIEDESPSPFQQIPQSLHYLESLSL
jgi:sugar phosphate isomerase/epimerase